MSWTTSLTELRELVSDGPTDKLRSRKRCVGVVDGTNKVFKTFEFRRVTDFTTAALPFGVFVSDANTASTVDIDDLATGIFTLHTAPTGRAFIEATYYTQYFIDAELTAFITHASRWLISSDDFTQITSGLQPSALKYAASEAYQKLSDKFQDTLSDTYRLEDMPDEKKTAMIQYYQHRAEYFKKAATEARDEFYTRQGQSLQPLFGNNAGAVRDIPPRD